MNRDYSRFDVELNRPPKVGDYLRDPVTGEVREILKVTRPEDITCSPYMRGSANENCALFGGSKDSYARKCSTHSPSHHAPRLKETA